MPDLDAELIAACRAGDESRVANLLAQGADANAHYFDPSYPDAPLSALYVATGEQDFPQVARLLLAAGAKTQDGESIYHAAQFNHTECLQVLADFGADFSAAHEKWGNTPLYFLLWPSGGKAGRTQLAGVRWLLEHGADPNVPSYDSGEMPLHRAVRWPDADAAELLLRHGADPNARSKDGVTPYATAVRRGNEAIAEVLSRHGATGELTPLDELLACCARGDGESAQALLDRDPALLASMTAADRALLPELAGDGRTDAVRVLLDIGLPVETTGEMGATALHHAAWRGQIDTVRLLLERGAPLDVRDSEYYATPLQWAMHGSENCKQPGGQYTEVTEAMLAAGAAPPEQG